MNKFKWSVELSKGNADCVIGWIRFLFENKRFIFIDSCISDSFSNSFSKPHVKTKQRLRSCGLVVGKDQISLKIFTENKKNDQAELVCKTDDKFEFEHGQLTIKAPRPDNQITYWILVIDGLQN